MDINGSAHARKSLSGIEKAAMLLLVMGKEAAVKLAPFFSQEEIQQLIRTASRFKTMEPQIINELVSEFRGNYVSIGMIPDVENLSEFFGEAKEADPKSRTAPPIRSDGTIADGIEPEIEEIIEFMDAEPAYVSVFLLSALGDEKAAEVFAALEPEKRKPLFRRYMERRACDPKLEGMMRRELFQVIANGKSGDDDTEKIEAAAGVMNFMPEDAVEELMGFIGDENPAAAEILKKSLFRFSEVVDLGKTERSLIIDQVDTDTIVQALGDANDALKESVLEVLSQRNRRMVEAELARGPAEEDVMLTAQRKIAAVVLRLVKEGKISLSAAEAA